ncbi:hypothetical protein HV819_02255 [Anaerococcus sp. AGMB00486]|uniref:Phage protein n=2 Tax=Anaerococcus TaxID=165779 RepID=A0ABX2N801_9FIRM|nr:MULTISPECIES: hypothetical protein [Anaerococcus]MSS77378.1 hypothetical protein [Anaerococcus porci]NVF10821.1 hypothetical protein [Anaerococcus faecalis]
MVFKRKNNNIKFEFECIDGEILKFETILSEDLANKLIDIGKIDYKNLSDEEYKNILIKAYDQILGKNAMDDIKELVFGGDDLSLVDIIDIGVYIAGEVNKYNDKINNLHGVLDKYNGEKMNALSK